VWLVLSCHAAEMEKIASILHKKEKKLGKFSFKKSLPCVTKNLYSAFDKSLGMLMITCHTYRLKSVHVCVSVCVCV